jgi:hypothetical protein
MRSEDFERIHIEFCDHYGQSKGDSEYYDWVRALSLDESKPYANAKESFRWAKTMLRALREDAENKYYGCLVGLPLMSMNGNIYHERDLIAAALSLKGKHPSLNHKDAFWFNEANRYGVLTVVDAKYEDGAVEAVLQVPKSAVCPICDGASMTSLIDNQHIVNVSLEGRNNGAFEFTDPPFTLLTSDVLPGIPLARIKPLEKIMSEAYHSTISTGKKRMIKAKVIEDQFQKTPASNETPSVNTKSIEDPDFKGTWGTPVTSDALLHSNTDSSGNTTVQMGESPANKVFTSTMPSKNEPVYTKTAVTSNVEEVCPEGTKWNPETGKCEPCAPEVECKCQEEDTSQPKPEDIRSGPTRSKAPDRSIPEAGSLPSSSDQTVWTGSSPATSKVVVGTAPVESLPTLEARRSQIHAELLAKDSEAKAVAWEQKHNEIYDKLTSLGGQYKGLSEAFDKLNQQLRNTEVDATNAKTKYNEQCGLVTDLKNTLNNARRELDETSRKYQESMQTNLSLSKKLTTANEEYLDIAKKLENTEEALNRAHNVAKKITRIQA